MRLKADNEFAALLATIGVDAQPGIRERSDQPGPDRPLMIGSVARTQVAVILRFIIRMSGSQRPQSERGQQTILDGVQHGLPMFRSKDGMRQRNGEYLIGSAGGIVAIFAIDDIEQSLLRRTPESLIE